MTTSLKCRPVKGVQAWNLQILMRWTWARELDDDDNFRDVTQTENEIKPRIYVSMTSDLCQLWVTQTQG